MAERIKIKTSRREELVDITDEVRKLIGRSGVTNGVVHLWSLHTTCALTVNEGADPDVQSDMTRFMRELVPQDAGFEHAEGNSDAHVKTSLFGPGLTLIVENGEPLLGTWQSVYLAEWDGPRSRTIAAHLISAD
ncbi:MAG TPA: secondary thiamine-phosphate synthase enzyme YjbQ [Longimicrobiales bacterium]